MADNLVVSVTPVLAAGGPRTAPQQLFKGVIRTQVRKALAKIIALKNADQREFVRATSLGYAPSFVTGPSGSHLETCFTRVENRLRECLTLKTGDE